MSGNLDLEQDGRILEAHVSGKLTKEDYEEFTPRAERAIDEHGKIRVLFDMHDFHGWNFDRSEAEAGRRSIREEQVQ